MSTDKFRHDPDVVWAPASACFVITPNDNQALPIVPKALRAPSNGVIVLRAIDSDTDVAHPVTAGEVIAVRAAYVRATGTDMIGTIIGYA